MGHKEKFVETSFNKAVGAIKGIDIETAKDIYALSFYYYFEEDEGRYAAVSISFNTISNFEANIASASGEREAKWNFAFWLQDEIGHIGGMEDKLLAEWFKETPFYYSQVDSEKAIDDDDLFEDILDKDAGFEEIFINEIIAVIKRLFNENIIRDKFGKDIPVLLHELEYFDRPLFRTIKSNPPGLVDEFATWINTMGASSGPAD